MELSCETRFKLNRFKPREYQIPIVNSIERHGYKRAMAVWPRRSGKDLIAWNMMIRAAVRRPGSYIYCLPVFSQCRRVLLNSRLNDGTGFLDFIPKELIKAFNQQEMKITLINDSIISMVGSNSYDSIVGSNALGIVVSEAAIADPLGISYLRPIVTANDGWMLLLSTPRGHNHFWEMYNVAKNSEKWFLSHLTVDDTQHITNEAIEQDVKDGILSKNLVMQEYWTSFDYGHEGAFYVKYLDKMRLNNQIGPVPWEPDHPVHTFWDLGIGVSDSTVILFVQKIGETIRIVDFYENNTEGLEYYIKFLKEKPYTYGKHFAPFDVKSKEWGSGMSRKEKAANLGFHFTDVPKLSIEDGIEAVRTILPRTWIDETKCDYLLRALNNYHKEWNPLTNQFRERPVHDKWSHACDALRYLAVSMKYLKTNASAEEIEELYREAKMGGGHNLPRIFRDHPYN